MAQDRRLSMRYEFWAGWSGAVRGCPRAHPESEAEMNHKLWLLGRLATVGGHILGEKITGHRARTIDDVPASGAALTTERLTAVLCRDTPGAEVPSFEIDGCSSGTSTRTAIRVEYHEDRRASDSA